MTPEYRTAPAFAAEGARHGFFTRKGGVTPGYLGALNCGSRFDATENILQNQKRAMDAIGFSAERLCILRQVHSAVVHRVGQQVPARTVEGDALVTNLPGTPLGILTADCVPILFHDPEQGVIGAAHAGWKGALGGVLEATIAAMVQLGADTRYVRAAIGPCIRQDSYEVGPEYIERFIEENAANRSFFRPSETPGHAYFDLPGYTKARLAQAGITAIADTGLDTCKEEADFFSCRRAHLAGEQGFGNGLSVICLES